MFTQSKSNTNNGAERKEPKVETSRRWQAVLEHAVSKVWTAGPGASLQGKKHKPRVLGVRFRGWWHG